MAQILNRRRFIVLSVLLLALIGCTEQRAHEESKQDSYAELARLLGSDISSATKDGTTTIEYCPDNTCESFSMPSGNPAEKLNDFVYLYLYSVSDYYALGDFRKKVVQEQVTKVILRNRQKTEKKEQSQSVKDVIESLAKKYSIKAKFVRYDESKRNEVDIDIKSRLSKDTTPSFPHGWRAPISSEIGDDWRKKDAERYLIVKSDFNGDGVIDEARLLVRDDGSGLGLFGFVSEKNRTIKTYLLDEMKGSGSIHAMGIKKVSPGSYKTACGKGYWACRKDEVPEITIQHDAVDYFKTESANSFFYWDAKASDFKRIWISD